jgi:hypothetical protein
MKHMGKWETMGKSLAYIFEHDIIVIVNEHVLRCFKYQSMVKYGNIATYGDRSVIHH